MTLCACCGRESDTPYDRCTSCKKHETPIATVLDKKIKEVQEDTASTIAQMYERANVVQRLLEAGVEIKNPYGAVSRYGENLKIDRSQLALVYKVLGSLKIIGKNVPGDFKETNQLTIVVQPRNPVYSCITLVYRVPYKGDGKCKIVETQTPGYTNRTLVCER